MKINKENILKNINAILCGLCVVSLIFPFCKVTASASVMGVSASESEAVGGFQIITGTGLWGILFIIGVVGVLVCNYIDQLKDKKKLVCMLGSFVMLLSLFMAPGNYSVSESAGGISAEVEVSYAIGFWLILIFTLCLLGVAVIGFFDLKGNVIFDAVNSNGDNSNGDETNGTGESQGMNVSFGNIRDRLSETAQNVKTMVTEKTSKNNAAEYVEVKNESNEPISITSKKDDNEYIMDQITKLFDMKEKGILSEEEFNQKKADLLSKL